MAVVNEARCRWARLDAQKYLHVKGLPRLDQVRLQQREFTVSEFSKTCRRN